MVGRGMLSEEKLKGLVKEFGTPAYVFDIHELRKRVKAIKGILGDQIELCFAMKANPFLISYLDPFVDKFEVCSPGEYLICKKEKIPAQKIVMSGVYKRLEDIKDSFQDNFLYIFLTHPKLTAACKAKQYSYLFLAILSTENYFFILIYGFCCVYAIKIILK